MKKLPLLLLSAVLLSCGVFVMPVQAEDELPSVLISEVQVAGSKEFVELYNSGSEAIDISCWRLEYRKAESTLESDWRTKLAFSCEDGTPSGEPRHIAPRGRLVVASYDLPDLEEERFAAGLRDDGGSLRIIQMQAASVMVHDLLGYGDALSGEGTPAPKAPVGKSLKRKINEDGYFIDTNNNAQDFFISQTPSPSTDALPEPMEALPDEEEEVSEPEEEVLNTPSATYLSVMITELLPDPASPLTDEDDEFIELYNPHETPIDLAGYRLESGSDYRYTFTLPSIVIAPKQYLAVVSRESHISLSNAGGKARIVKPSGDVIEEVVYAAAKVGQSWVRNNNEWAWSVVPTSGKENILAPPQVLTAATAKAKKATASSKPKAATKAKAPAAPKAPKAAAKPKEPSAAALAQPASLPQSPNYWLLAPVGVVVVGYALFEYRQEMSKLWQRIRQRSGK